MLHNDSHKSENALLGLTIPEDNSMMFGSLSGSKLGIRVAYGEGKFSLPKGKENYSIITKYSYNNYPGNPNDSDHDVAGICSKDGRHLAMMPHLECFVFPWQSTYYPYKRHADEVTSWIEAFANTKEWVEKQVQQAS